MEHNNLVFIAEHSKLVVSAAQTPTVQLVRYTVCYGTCHFLQLEITKRVPPLIIKKLVVYFHRTTRFLSSAFPIIQARHVGIF